MIGPTDTSFQIASDPASTGVSPGGLDRDAFLKLLVAQVQYQNPLEPMDAAGMMEQTTQLASMEMLTRLATVQQRLLAIGQMEAAGELVGRQVTGTGPSGLDVTGMVEGFRRQGDRVLLEVAGTEIDVESVREVND